MAVDLTTGTYDEDGIFNKYDENSTISKKFNADEVFSSLKNFRTECVIKECLNEKSLIVEGHFSGDDKKAIVIFEKMPIDTRDLTRIFNADCRLELKFRNNIYANYHVYPSAGFNGFDVKVIYPASAEDFSKFIDEPLRIVSEPAETYNSVVLPYFKSISSSKSFQDIHPNATIIFEEQNLQPGFIFFESIPENCSCSTKHIRSVCVIKDENLLSLRDLTAEHIPLLNCMKQKCLEQLTTKYGIPSSKFLIYVRYPPEHYPLHIFFETVEKDIPLPAEKAHHLDSLICNLQLIPDYYKKVTLTYSLAEKDSLLKIMFDTSNNK